MLISLTFICAACAMIAYVELPNNFCITALLAIRVDSYSRLQKTRTNIKQNTPSKEISCKVTWLISTNKQREVNVLILSLPRNSGMVVQLDFIVNKVSTELGTGQL